MTSFQTYNFGGNTASGMSAHYHLSRDAKNLDLYDYHITSPIPIPSLADVKGFVDRLTPKVIVLNPPGTHGQGPGGGGDGGFASTLRGGLGL